MSTSSPSLHGLTAEAPTLLSLDRRESRIRLLTAASLCVLAYVQLYGLIWDIQWHVDVGRDRFLTPPHLLLYMGMGLSGLIALAVVLVETLRFRQGAPELNAQTTASILGIFHAPLGVIMAGFGSLVGALSAPLDDYWHQLYGIDVTLWSPFHVMGAIGGAIGNLGLICLLASEAARARARGELRTTRARLLHPTQAALVLGVASILLLLLIMTLPATGTSQGYIRLGGQYLLFMYPLLLAVFLPLGMVLVAILAESPFAATGVALALLGVRGFAVGSLPGLVETLRIEEHLVYRPGSPVRVLVADVLPWGLLLGAMLVDAYRVYARHAGKVLSGAVIALCATAPVLVTATAYLAPRSPKSRALLEAADLPSSLLITGCLALVLLLMVGRLAARMARVLARVSR